MHFQYDRLYSRLRIAPLHVQDLLYCYNPPYDRHNMYLAYLYNFRHGTNNSWKTLLNVPRLARKNRYDLAITLVPNPVWSYGNLRNSQKIPANCGLD